MGKIVICGNKKGGVGKSLTTLAFANYLDSLGKEVCILDCDDEQPTLADKRKVDINKGKDADNMYSITSMLSEEAAPQLKEVYKDHYDYTFVDLPGNLKQSGVFECYLNSDIIFLMFNVTNEDLSATTGFYKRLIEAGYKGEIYGVPSKIKPAYKEWHRWLDYKEPTEEEKERGVFYTHHSQVDFKLADGWIKDDQILWSRFSNTVDIFSKTGKDNPILELFEELTKKIG
jgi:hypothetical protein